MNNVHAESYNLSLSFANLWILVPYRNKIIFKARFHIIL